MLGLLRSGIVGGTALMGADLVPDQLLGPYALLVAALVVVYILWRAHLAADADMKAQRDLAQSREAVALDGWKGQTDATNKLTAAIRDSSRRDSARRRLGDSKQVAP